MNKEAINWFFLPWPYVHDALVPIHLAIIIKTCDPCHLFLLTRLIQSQSVCWYVGQKPFNLQTQQLHQHLLNIYKSRDQCPTHKLVGRPTIEVQVRIVSYIVRMWRWQTAHSGCPALSVSIARILWHAILRVYKLQDLRISTYFSSKNVCSYTIYLAW